MEMTIQDLVQFVRDGGLVVGVLLVLFTGFKRWWVWGYQLADAQRERDEWKTLFLRTLNVAETSVSVTRTITKNVD